MINKNLINLLHELNKILYKLNNYQFYDIQILIY